MSGQGFAHVGLETLRIVLRELAEVADATPADWDGRQEVMITIGTARACRNVLRAAETIEMLGPPPDDGHDWLPLSFDRTVEIATGERLDMFGRYVGGVPVAAYNVSPEPGFAGSRGRRVVPRAHPAGPALVVTVTEEWAELLKAAKATLALGGIDALERLLRRRSIAHVLDQGPGKTRRARKQGFRYVVYEQYLAENLRDDFPSFAALQVRADLLARARRSGLFVDAVLRGGQGRAHAYVNSNAVYGKFGVPFK